MTAVMGKSPLADHHPREEGTRVDFGEGPAEKGVLVVSRLDVIERGRRAVGDFVPATRVFARLVVGPGRPSRSLRASRWAEERTVVHMFSFGFEKVACGR